jgi:uridine phosphorylase
LFQQCALPTGFSAAMPDPLLFVAADPRECTGLVSHWEGVRATSLPVNWARSGRWKGRDAIAIANGAGAERAFAAVILAARPTAVCNLGFCGALDESLRIGDVVIVLEVQDGTRQSDRKYETLVPDINSAKSFALSGSAISITRVAQTASEKRNLRATGASIVEMEAAGAARAAEDLGLPFYCIRAVSDLAGEDFENDFNGALDSDGRFSALRLITGALASPRKRFGELLRLKQRTAIASKKLGDFLADCTFPAR